MARAQRTPTLVQGPGPIPRRAQAADCCMRTTAAQSTSCATTAYERRGWTQTPDLLERRTCRHVRRGPPGPGEKKKQKLKKKTKKNKTQGACTSLNHLPLQEIYERLAKSEKPRPQETFDLKKNDWRIR